MIAGRPLDQVFPRKMQSRGELKLEVKDLSTPGLARINFAAHAGEIVGLAGVEGEGQREFLRTVAGLERRKSGSVLIKGKPVEGTSAAAARAAGIGLRNEDALRTARDRRGRLRIPPLSHHRGQGNEGREEGHQQQPATP